MAGANQEAHAASARRSETTPSHLSNAAASHRPLAPAHGTNAASILLLRPDWLAVEKLSPSAQYLHTVPGRLVQHAYELTT